MLFWPCFIETTLDHFKSLLFELLYTQYITGPPHWLSHTQLIFNIEQCVTSSRGKEWPMLIKAILWICTFWSNCGFAHSGPPDWLTCKLVAAAITGLFTLRNKWVQNKLWTAAWTSPQHSNILEMCTGQFLFFKVDWRTITMKNKLTCGVICTEHVEWLIWATSQSQNGLLA